MKSFLQFQATRTPCDDLSQHPDLSPEYFVDGDCQPRTAPGFVYDGSAYIERTSAGSYYLVLGNEETTSANLEMLERALYEWCCAECPYEHQMTAATLADAFARAIIAALSADELAQLRAYSADDSTCLSHDFIDANQVMIDVYEQMNGPNTFDIDDDNTMDMIEDAWEMARASGWSIKP
jgi:hypothetical protein